MEKLSREKRFQLLNPNFENSLAFRLKKIRKVNMLTQDEFAEKLGISKRAYIHYESAERLVTSDILSKICRDFCIDASWLLLGVGDGYRNYDEGADPVREEAMHKSLEAMNAKDWHDEPAMWRPEDEEAADAEDWLQERVNQLDEQQRRKFKRTGELPPEKLPSFGPAKKEP